MASSLQVMKNMGDMNKQWKTFRNTVNNDPVKTEIAQMTEEQLLSLEPTPTDEMRSLYMDHKARLIDAFAKLNTVCDNCPGSFELE